MGLRTYFFAAILTLSASCVRGRPVFGLGNTRSNTAASALSSDQTNAFVTPARFSQIAYCSSKSVLKWNCGPPCQTLPGIKPILAGGDDGLIPLFFIAHDPTSKSIVVAHRGTDPQRILSIANDAQILLRPLDRFLFPNVNPNIRVHEGFSKAFGRTAKTILGNVTAALQSTGATQVNIHGHSLGAAIAVMDAVFLRRNLPRSISVSAVVFGLPRGGNQEWANFVDQTVPGLVHIHNKNDAVSIVPPRVLHYQHPSGEIHIQANGTSVNCPGQENQNLECVARQSVLRPSVANHLGPYYDNISLEKPSCAL